ncbi:UDP-4-amino-4,6-dideoxy-N-acetyl-beta-L-altrosamine transaminase [Spartobacteria bacterium LR76]|nr:UDP-4-amino-4,6-dideoxy-N-acetyl-beta-L-altrosamine transaminase [Spartobacteria bacterium LR76]
MIPYGRQEILQSDIDAVVGVLRSDFLTQGPAVPAFEQAVAVYCGAAHAVAVNSATSALHIACLALGLGKGDRLWTSPITFVASANCGLYCGAEVDFVDIDPETFNLCPQALERKLIEAERAGRLPKVVVPVHLCGTPCDMAAIHALGQRFGFRVIEDASHAIGARDGQNIVGSCRYSDITVFSFHPVKIVTSGEGGVAVTNDGTLAHRMSLLRSHGITRDPGEMTAESEGAWYYQQIDLGFNYRMTDIHAALGRSQMERLEAYVARRHELVGRYREELSGSPVTFQRVRADQYPAFHLFVIRIKAEKKSRAAVFQFLRENGIGVNVHYIPVHLQPYYRSMGFNPGDFPAAESYYREAISLPLYPGLRDEDLRKVVQSLKECLAQ